MDAGSSVSLLRSPMSVMSPNYAANRTSDFESPPAKCRRGELFPHCIGGIAQQALLCDEVSDQRIRRSPFTARALEAAGLEFLGSHFAMSKLPNLDENLALKVNHFPAHGPRHMRRDVETPKAIPTEINLTVQQLNRTFAQFELESDYYDFNGFSSVVVAVNQLYTEATYPQLKSEILTAIMPEILKFRELVLTARLAHLSGTSKAEGKSNAEMAKTLDDDTKEAELFREAYSQDAEQQSANKALNRLFFNSLGVILNTGRMPDRRYPSHADCEFISNLQEWLQ